MASGKHGVEIGKSDMAWVFKRMPECSPNLNAKTSR
jgi:hypothetical protein